MWEKTKASSKQSSPLRIMIVQKQSDNVECFSYLDSVIISDVRYTREIKSRIALAKAAFNKKKRLSQMKHQLDATLCRFYFCRVTLHVSGASAHHQEYLKLVRRPLVDVFCKNI